MDHKRGKHAFEGQIFPAHVRHGQDERDGRKDARKKTVFENGKPAIVVAHNDGHVGGTEREKKDAKRPEMHVIREKEKRKHRVEDETHGPTLLKPQHVASREPSRRRGSGRQIDWFEKRKKKDHEKHAVDEGEKSHGERPCGGRDEHAGFVGKTRLEPHSRRIQHETTKHEKRHGQQNHRKRHVHQTGHARDEPFGKNASH